jgi:hypothetical protein
LGQQSTDFADTGTKVAVARGPQLAERLASSSDRRLMLKLAEAWVELANRTHDRGLPPQMHIDALS